MQADQIGYVGQSLSVDPTLIGSAHYLQISRMAKAYHRTYSHASSIFLARQSSSAMTWTCLNIFS